MLKKDYKKIDRANNIQKSKKSLIYFKRTFNYSYENNVSTVFLVCMKNLLLWIYDKKKRVP